MAQDTQSPQCAAAPAGLEGASERPPARVPATTRARPARGGVLNLVGQGVPALVGIVAVPALIRGLGTERFGFLTIAWMLIGYFSLFDLGLSRALTQLVAERVGRTGSNTAPTLVWPALRATLLLGCFGGGTLAAIASWLVHSVLRISPALQHEALTGMYILAVGTPLVVLTAGFQGILAAFHRFGTLNAIRVPLGLMMFLAPLAVLPFGQSLVLVTAVLVACRLLICAVHYLACRRLLPPLRASLGDPEASLRPLFRFGLWMTLTNILSPMLQYLDRFFIGASVSVSAVAWYATPYEAITKLLIIPSAISAALFPAFAGMAHSDREGLFRLMVGGVKSVALLLFPAVLMVEAFAPELLRLWLGPEFALHGAPVLRWLALGVFLNAQAQVFLAVIQGVGRPDVSAKFHLLEVPIYVGLLWAALARWGIAGAAAVWTLRVALDAALLLAATRRHSGATVGAQLRVVGTSLAGVVAVALPALPGSAVVRCALVAGVVVFVVPMTWRFVLRDTERAALRRRLRLGGA